MVSADTKFKPLSLVARLECIYAQITKAHWWGSALFVSILAWEISILPLLASRNLFWYDELLTFHVSGLRPFSLLWQALQTGVDGMPPSYYAMVQLARMLPGNTQITLRLPSILGYVLTLLGVYCFVRKRLQASVGVAAVLLIVLSPFREYALEARSYSLLVGFLAISSVLWQRIDESALMKPLFAVFLTLAVSCHNYGVVAISCIGIAELSWTLLSRKIRWGVWAAFLTATIPFFIQLPILLNFRSLFGKEFWSKPSWTMSVETYRDYLTGDAKLVLVFIVFFTILVLISRPQGLTGRGEGARGPFSVPEIVLITAYLFYPPLLYVLTRLGGGGYTPRYGWPVILGLALGAVYTFCTVTFRPASGYIVGALLIVFFYQGLRDVRELITPASPAGDEHWMTLAELSRANMGIPIVIGSGLRFLEAAKYAPPEVREKLFEVTDPKIAVRLIGTDSVDKANRLLAQFIPLRVEDVASFETAHPAFMLVSGGSFDWFTKYVLEKKYRLTLLSTDDQRVYLAER